mgnify:CR=1 FL=1|tara:strand:- start:284 stop:520 length:237 start_codon:yes stop_codon:yes gene_type:complete
MCLNRLELDEVCNIAGRVYFDVIDHLDMENLCVEFDEDTGGTKNTEYGMELYYLIEDSVKSAIKYKEEDEEEEEHEDN